MSEAERRLAAALADRYRIERELGEGGMATVYLAEDLKHHRQVAIKVLKPELAAVLGAERFIQEITTTAQLQHPHILPLFDSGTADGFLFYVMPYIEGETLRNKLDRETQLGVEEAVKITTEVADALDYAHRHGVIHRDIKPENILLHDGRPMVADFGIALAVSAAAGGRMTETGMSLGTPHYMSPEQATADKEITGRSDVYSLASVLYEMLTGDPPHTGSSAQQIIVKIIAEDPAPVDRVRHSVPPNVAAALSKALEKLPADRFPSAAGFARALGDPAFRLPSETRAAPSEVTQGRAGLLRRVAPWLVAGASLAVALVLGVALRTRSAGSTPGRATFASLDVQGLHVSGDGFNSFDVSPDGRRVVFTVDRSDDAGLAIRSLDSAGVQLVPQTRGATFPFWAPDGRSIGFFTADSLETVDLASGAVRPLCGASSTGGGTWAADGTILFSSREGLERTSATGGPCRRVVLHPEPPTPDVTPYFLPDGRHFVVTMSTRTWLAQLGQDSLVLLTNQLRNRAVLAPPAYLLWDGSDGLVAQRIDVGGRSLAGEPVRILPRMAQPGSYTSVSASAGVLVAMPRLGTGPAADTTAALRGGVAVIERGGGALELKPFPGPVWASMVAGGAFPVSVSHDGRHVVMGGWSIEAMDLATGHWVHVGGAVVPKRDISTAPLWSPRDTAVLFLQVFLQGMEHRELRLASLKSGAVRTVAPVPFRQLPACCSGAPEDWSPDGRRVLFTHGSSASTHREAWEYDLATDTVRHLFDAPGEISDLRYDPAGGWIAYQVTTGPQTDVFLRPYPGPGQPMRVSSGGARAPRWRADGSELFYLDTRNDVVAVPVHAGRAATVATVGPGKVVVPGRVLAQWKVNGFDVAPDGQRFVFALNSKIRSFRLVLDWQRLLTRRSP